MTLCYDIDLDNYGYLSRPNWIEYEISDAEALTVAAQFAVDEKINKDMLATFSKEQRDSVEYAIAGIVKEHEIVDEFLEQYRAEIESKYMDEAFRNANGF